jgi:MoaA/NifB/PqqE/SkfB family radical SAM enzyme
MKLLAPLRSAAKPLGNRFPILRDLAHGAEEGIDRARHSIATVWPGIIRPDPREIFVTLTADCNFRCDGCRYGRDFHAGHELPLPIVLDLLDDAKALGIRSIRLYGGEPLLHKDLPKIVEHSVNLGLHTWLTTNGLLLRKKIDDLYAAGLREIALGYYGHGDAHASYTHRRGAYAKMEEGVAYTRQKYGNSVRFDVGWLLMRPTCTFESLHAAWDFALRYNAPMSVNLVHYSLPYFTEGNERELAFRPEDRPQLEAIVQELLRLKRQRPDMLSNSEIGLRSVPDWLMRGPDMRVPCDRYRLIWIGANGVVQLCYVTFEFGNLHQNRLRDLLFTPQHGEASRDAFQLNCPNCHCSFDERTRLHAPSRRAYAN